MTRAVLTIIFSLAVSASASSVEARETHGAHTHGVANLTLAIESGSMEVQFESPAASLLGFEHTPTTQRHIEAIEKTKAFLNSPENVFSIQGADCQVNNSKVVISGPAGKPLAASDNEPLAASNKEPLAASNNEASAKVGRVSSASNHEALENDHHDDGHHRKEPEKHHSDQDDGDSDGHSEISALYLSDCSDGKTIESITIEMFERFPKLEKINVNWVTEVRQGQDVLSPQSQTIKLR